MGRSNYVEEQPARFPEEMAPVPMKNCLLNGGLPS
jgi:hypothetical protein